MESCPLGDVGIFMIMDYKDYSHVLMNFHLYCYMPIGGYNPPVGVYFIMNYALPPVDCGEIPFENSLSHVVKRLKKTPWTVWYGGVDGSLVGRRCRFISLTTNILQ